MVDFVLETENNERGRLLLLLFIWMNTNRRMFLPSKELLFCLQIFEMENSKGFLSLMLKHRNYWGHNGDITNNGTNQREIANNPFFLFFFPTDISYPFHINLYEWISVSPQHISLVIFFHYVWIQKEKGDCSLCCYGKYNWQ